MGGKDAAEPRPRWRSRSAQRRVHRRRIAARPGAAEGRTVVGRPVRRSNPSGIRSQQRSHRASRQAPLAASSRLDVLPQRSQLLQCCTPAQLGRERPQPAEPNVMQSTVPIGRQDHCGESGEPGSTRLRCVTDRSVLEDRACRHRGCVSPGPTAGRRAELGRRGDLSAVRVRPGDFVVVGLMAGRSTHDMRRARVVPRPASCSMPNEVRGSVRIRHCGRA